MRRAENLPHGAIYAGAVVHKRVFPVRHSLRYRVFSLLLDVDRLDEVSGRLRFFSHNRGNVVSLHDADHGDGTPLPAYLRAIASRAGEGENVERFMMLCYPRVFGYVFNPLTVYFGLDHRGQIRLVIYEVSNTFGERMSYVLRASASSSGHVDQDCRKEFHVSPFNKAGGIYRFRVSPIGDILKVAIRLEENDRTLMTAYFDARKIELTDAALMARVARTGWMTVKVIAAIHLEAAKLWLKGLRLHPRPRPPEPPISYEGR